MKSHRNNQAGFAMMAVVAVVGVILLGAVGYVAWNNFGKQKAAEVTADVANKVALQAASAECLKKYDQDICKFMTNWALVKQYRMTSTDGAYKMVVELDGDKTRFTMTGQGQPSQETITIDKTTYTKAGSVWYKQTAKDTPKQDMPKSDFKSEFKEPSKDDPATEEDKTEYKKLGKEACGNLQCFKYEIVDPANTTTKQFGWFDDKDYKLRKYLTQTPEGNSEQTFEYDNISVKAPSPVKELAADEYLMPGATEPTKMPTGFAQ
jgi:uncharacterized protein (UPF0333 family)